MPVYNPPLRDMQFVMHEVLHVCDDFRAMPAHADIDADTINAVLEEAGKFAAEVTFPLNRIGDTQGCTLEARAFAEAMDDFAAAGATVRYRPMLLGALFKGAGSSFLWAQGAAGPVAPRAPHDVTVHGDTRVDDYFWMRQRDDPRLQSFKTLGGDRYQASGKLLIKPSDTFKITFAGDYSKKNDDNGNGFYNTIPGYPVAVLSSLLNAYAGASTTPAGLASFIVPVTEKFTGEFADGFIPQSLTLDYAKNTLPGVIDVMVMKELAQPRDAFVLNRGEYDKPDLTKPCEPGVPTRVFPWNETLPKNRLGLARWLTDPQHPLTSRVVINRLWAQVFGAGLVAAAADFCCASDACAVGAAALDAAWATPGACADAGACAAAESM